MSTPDLETIMGLARKLSALAAEDSGATAGERAAALGKLERLMDRNGLQLSDLTAERLHDVPFKVANKGEALLLYHCAFHVLDVSSLARTAPSTWKKKGKAKHHTVTLHGLTLVAACDIRICFNHYRIELHERELELRAKARLAMAALRKAPLAVIATNAIWSSKDEKSEPAPVDLKGMEALMAAMRGMEENRWQKPVGEIQDVLKLH